MNININNEAILLNEEILWAEKSLRNTQEMLQEKLNHIEMFGMPRSANSCLQMNRQLDILYKAVAEKKAELAALPGFVSL